MRAVVLIVVAFIFLSGCIEENPQQTKQRVLDFVETNGEFSEFMQNHSFADVLVQKIERESSGLFQDPVVLERAERECGKKFTANTYWRVKAVEIESEIELLINESGDLVECVMTNDYCTDDAECDNKIACTIDFCSGVTKRCESIPITTCGNEDSCCPGDCDYLNDNDCPRGLEVFEVPEVPEDVEEQEPCEDTIDCDDEEICTIDYCNAQTTSCNYINKTDGSPCRNPKNGLTASCQSGMCIYDQIQNPKEFSASFPSVADLSSIGLDTIGLYCFLGGWTTGDAACGHNSYSCIYNVKKGADFYSLDIYSNEWNTNDLEVAESCSSVSFHNGLQVYSGAYSDVYTDLESTVVRENFVGKESFLAVEKVSDLVTMFRLHFTQKGNYIRISESKPRVKNLAVYYDLLESVARKIDGIILGNLSEPSLPSEFDPPECESDADCDDGNSLTSNRCSGNPKKCSFAPIPASEILACEIKGDCDDAESCTIDSCDPQNFNCENENKPEGYVCMRSEGGLTASCQSGRCTGDQIQNTTEVSASFPTVGDLSSIGLETLGTFCQVSMVMNGNQPCDYNTLFCAYDVKKEGEFYSFEIYDHRWKTNSLEVAKSCSEKKFSIPLSNVVRENFAGERSFLEAEEVSGRLTNYNLELIQSGRHIIINKQRPPPKNPSAYYDFLESVAKKVEERILISPFVYVNWP